MNTKTLFKLGTMLVILLVLVVGNAFAAKYYVNVINGLDGFNGLSPVVGGTGVGPKQTINNAIAAASPGDTIYVDYANGNLYNQAVVVNKGLVMGTTNNNGTGTPVVYSLQINDALVAPNNTVTFIGPFLLQQGLELTAGLTLGGGNLTVATAVIRDAAAATVDVQVLYSGPVTFTYNATMTTGPEMVPASNTTTATSLTTAAAAVLTLGNSVTINGVLTTGAALALGGNTLTIAGTSGAHAIGGNVTGGTLAFNMVGGGATFSGAFTIPTLTITDDASNQTLFLVGVTTTGDITASATAWLSAPAATTSVGNVTNNGAGRLAFAGAVATKSLTNASSGFISLNAAGATTVTGSVSQSGKGGIIFNSTASNNITGNVTNNPTLAITSAAVTNPQAVFAAPLVIVASENVGVIRFWGDVPVTIGGNVLVQPTFTGTPGAATAWANAGEIAFIGSMAASQASPLTISGSLTVSASHSLSAPAAVQVVSNVGSFISYGKTGNITIGGVANSTVWATVTNITAANNGNIDFSARTTGTFSAGAVSSTSISTADFGHGNILFGGTSGGFSATTITTTGGKGGKIYIASTSAPFTTTGTVTNSRSSVADYILVGSAPTAGATVTIGGDMVQNGAATTHFASFQGAGAESFGVTGQLNISAGTVRVDGLQTGTGSFTFGTVYITGGKFNIDPAAGAGVMNIVVNGNSTWTGGTVMVGSTAFTRTLTLGGLAHAFAAPAGQTDFVVADPNNVNVTLVISPVSIISTQNITGNATTAVWPGPMTVNNGSGLLPSVNFGGGDFRVLGNVTFAAGQVSVNGVTLFIGGQLAPNVGSGSFTNTAGYVTTAVGVVNGFVSMNGIAAQTVGGAGAFGNFETDNLAGVTVNAAGSFTGTYNLTRGAVTATLVKFNNAANPPTIVVNAGTFSAPPTFNSMVNVYYIGLDKSVGNELPSVAVNKLNNLTVATTNGTFVSGQGVVNVNVATKVNGTINIFPGQALQLNGASLTMLGPTITLNGDLVNVTLATDKLILAAATGTTITGPGALPDITVNAGSVGNVINGSVGLCSDMLNADLGYPKRGGDVDNLPGSTGSITYAGGAASSLTVAFGTPNATTKANFLNLTTATGGTFTLGANLTEYQTGNMTIGTGSTVDVGAFVFTYKGAAPSFDGGAALISTPGTGTMLFLQTAATTLTLTSSAATISAPITVSTSPAATPFTFLQFGQNLTVSTSLTLSGAATYDVGLANLTVTGSAVTMNAGTAFAASGGGILKLNATTPPLTFAYTGTATIVNLTILNNVTLANGPGGAATALTVTGVLLHTAGTLNFGAINLTAGGTYTNTAGTYLATTGYLIFSGTVFNQGTAGITIPNLRFTNAGAVTAGGTGMVNVTTALDMNSAAAAPSFTHAGTLNVATGATVNWTQGAFDVAPVYAGTITLVSLNAAVAAIPTSIWPATAALVTTFKNSGAGATSLPGSRQVNTALYLNNGVLSIGANTLTMAANSTVYRKFGGSVTVGTGALVYGTNETVVYQADGASVYPAVPTFVTGIELPATIPNLTFTRSANVANGAVQIGNGVTPFTVTVTGTLSIMNDVITPDQEVAPLVAATVNVSGNLVIATDAFALATAPVVKIGNLSFTGTVTQSATLAGPLSLTNLTLNMPTGGVVNVVGGSITVTNLVFINGLLVVPSPYAVILAGHNVAGQGYNHTGVVYPNLSHVVGNVQQAVAAGAGAAGTNGRFEFPVGGMLAYRPMAITFTPAYVANNPTNILVAMVDNSPAGVVGLPIDGGNGVKVGNYPQYYWLVQATPSSFTSTQAFDVDLQGTNLGYPFTNVADLRIIRRQDGQATSNQWQVQGTATNYTNNYISVQGPTMSDSTIFVRASSASGGIVFQATRFTIGIPTRPPIFTAAPTILAVDEAQTLSAQFTAVSQNANLQQTITYSLNGAPAGMAISSTGLLTWSPAYGKRGTYTFTVGASDGQFNVQTATITLTVTAVNRPPAFSPRTIAKTLKSSDTLRVALSAVDPDTLSTVTYSIISFLPAPTNAATITGANLTWMPAFADAPKSFVLLVLASDGVTTGHGPTPGTDTLTINITVNRARLLGDVDGNGLVQAADAALVLQYVAGIYKTTDPATLYAMDASKNGTITAYDASLILQAAAGLIPPLTNTVSGLGKSAIVQATGSLNMASPQATTSPEVMKVGLKIANPANVYSVQLTTKADFSLVSIDAVNASLPDGWNMQWNVVNGQLIIAAAGTTPLPDGDVASIMVHLKSKESRVNFSTDAMLNENFQSLGAVEVAAIPTAYALEQNYPNPFNPSTTIRYQIPNDANVNLIIYNVQGQKVRTLVSNEQKAGYYNVVWDGRNEAGQTVSSGLYLYRVQAGSFVATQKMLMLK